MHPRLRQVLIAAIAMAAIVAAWNLLSPGRRLHAAQRALLEAVSAKDEEACLKLVSEQYRDSRGWTYSDWPGLLSDLRAVAPSLTFSGEFDEVSSGLLEGHLKVTGIGPAAAEIQRELRRLRAPTAFQWKRESWTPWSWRLQSIENPDLDVSGRYRPGRLDIDF